MVTATTTRTEFLATLSAAWDKSPQNAAIRAHYAKVAGMAEAAWPAHRAKLLGMQVDPGIQAAAERMAKQIVRRARR